MPQAKLRVAATPPARPGTRSRRRIPQSDAQATQASTKHWCKKQTVEMHSPHEVAHRLADATAACQKPEVGVRAVQEGNIQDARLVRVGFGAVPVAVCGYGARRAAGLWAAGARGLAHAS